MSKSTWLTKLCKFSQAEDQNPFSSVNFLFEEARETERAMAREINIIDIIDGFADSAFVSLSGLRKTLKHVEVPGKLTDLVIPEEDIEKCISEIMETVCEANLAKTDEKGEFLRDENGKVTKPEGWTPPEVKLAEIVTKYAKKPISHTDNTTH